MRYISAAIRAVLAAVAAVILVPVVEAGRLVWKLTRTALGASPTADALAEQDALLSQDAPAAPAGPLPDDVWGRAALAYLAEGDVPNSRSLDAAAREYLDGLTIAQAEELATRSAGSIGRHLLGTMPIQGLPRAMNAVEWMNRETDRLAASTAELQATVAASQRHREQDAVTQRILDFLMDDTPSCQPRGA